MLHTGISACLSQLGAASDIGAADACLPVRLCLTTTCSCKNEQSIINRLVKTSFITEVEVSALEGSWAEDHKHNAVRQLPLPALLLAACGAALRQH
jgi:hypothetical protein